MNVKCPKKTNHWAHLGRLLKTTSRITARSWNTPRTSGPTWCRRTNGGSSRTWWCRQSTRSISHWPNCRPGHCWLASRKLSCRTCSAWSLPCLRSRLATLTMARLARTTPMCSRSHYTSRSWRFSTTSRIKARLRVLRAPWSSWSTRRDQSHRHVRDGADR